MNNSVLSPQSSALIFKTPWGWAGIAASARGVRAIVLPKASRRSVERALRAQDAAPLTLPSPRTAGERARERGTLPLLDGAQAQIMDYLAGRRRTLEFPIDLSSGTPFQRRVWGAIRSIPSGQLRSYKWVARRVGGARYARAVGAALGANPVPLIVPCHRVIATDGSLGGFSGGLRTKRRLLALEGTIKSKS